MGRSAVTGLRRLGDLPLRLLLTTLAIALSGCAGLDRTFADTPSARVETGAASNDAAALHAALAYHRRLNGFGAAELATARSALANQQQTPMTQFRLAMALAHGQGGTLARARSLLDALMSSEKSEARALAPLARMVADHVADRQRLEATSERLAQQVERNAQQLRDSQQQRDELQAKLDALTEIERSLPARTPASTAPLDPSTERKNSR